MVITRISIKPLIGTKMNGKNSKRLQMKSASKCIKKDLNTMKFPRVSFSPFATWNILGAIRYEINAESKV